MPGNRILDLDDIGNIFFRDGYNLAREYLADGLSKDRLTMLMTAAYEAVDGLIISFRNRCLREGLHIDCAQGCSWCCHQAVLVSTQEVLLISRYLSREMAEEQQLLVCRNAREKEAVTGDMSVREFLQYLHPCPFLLDHSCLIYPVRPMACRCYLSSDVDSCLAQYNQPGNRQIMAALYDFPLRAGRLINEGIRAVLMQNRVITSEWLLEVLISKTMAHPGIFDEWLSGEDPFTIRALSADENEYLREYRHRQESFNDVD
jgi:hypothetical protein